MKKSITYFVFLSFFAFTMPLCGQNLQWLKGFGGNGDEFPYDMCVDQQGNVYTTGQFAITTDFDPGPGTHTINGNADIFISKLDANGTFKWAAAFGDVATDAGNGIATDAAGNVYVTGMFAHTVDFDPGPGVTNCTAAKTGFDVFVLKLDTDGNLVWVQSFGGDNWDNGNAIALDGTGNIYVSGEVYNDTADFDPGPATHTLITGVFGDFVSKFDNDGNFIQVVLGGGGDIVADAAGNVFVCERFGVTKYDLTGNLVWQQQPPATALALDKDGYLLMAGSYISSTDFVSGPANQTFTTAGPGQDNYVQKLDSVGKHVWIKTFSGADRDEVHDITSDQAGHVYLAGQFQLTADFDPGPGVYTLTSQGSMNGYLLRVDENGNFLGAKRFGGPWQDNAAAVALDPSGAVYCSGFFSHTADFETSTPGTHTLLSQPTGFHDVFVLKLNSVVGLSEVEDDHGFSLFPNPAHQFVNVFSTHPGPVEVTITDITGRQVHSQGLDSTETQLQLGTLARGMYIISFSNEQYGVSRKLVVE